MGSVASIFKRMTGILAGWRVSSAPASTTPGGATPGGAIAGGVADFGVLSDEELLAGHRAIIVHSREVDTWLNASAAEIAKRSDRTLGQQGRARRHGHVNPAAMLQSLSGASQQESYRQIQIGTLIAQPKPPPGWNTATRHTPIKLSLTPTTGTPR